MGIQANANQVLQSPTGPEVGGEEGGIALLGTIVGDDQTRKDAVQMAQNLVLEHGLYLDLAQPYAIQVLELQVDSSGRPIGSAFSATQQVTDGGGVDLIAFLTMHHMLISVLADGIAVDQLDWLRSLEQMAGQVFKVMAGGLHTQQNQLRPGPQHRFINGLTQSVKASLQDIDLKEGCHNVAQGIMNHHDMEVLADIQGDAQDLLRRDTPNLVSERLSAFTPQVGTSFSAHGCYLRLLKRLVRMPIGEVRTGPRDCASPAIDNGIRPRHMMGRRYFIQNVEGVEPPRKP